MEIKVEEFDSFPQGAKIQIFAKKCQANKILPKLPIDSIVIVYAPDFLSEYFEPYLKLPKGVPKGFRPTGYEYREVNYPYWFESLETLPKMFKPLLDMSKIKKMVLYFCDLVPTPEMMEKLLTFKDVTIIFDGTDFPKIPVEYSGFVGFSKFADEKVLHMTAAFPEHLFLAVKGEQYYYI